MLAFNLARHNLEATLHDLGVYVNFVAKGDATLVEKSGFPSYQFGGGATPGPSPIPAAPQNVKLRAGDLSGTIVARCKADRTPSFNVAQINTGKRDDASASRGQPRSAFSQAFAGHHQRQPFALHLTPGEAHDGRQFESLCESLDPDNVLESAAPDRGHDADRIRERLAVDDIQPVIPPISKRSKKLHCDEALCRQRNRIERFLSKLKQFRRIATRNDKLRNTFFSALCLIAAFLIAKNS